jgi:hypothetical protein
VLRALHRILTPGGRLAFTTIERSPGLARAQRRALAPSAPRAVASRFPYSEMLHRAGFVDVGQRDATDEYLVTIRRWIAATEPVRDLVAAVDGAEQVAERLQAWRDAVEMVSRGWLRRTLYWAAAPV